MAECLGIDLGEDAVVLAAVAKSKNGFAVIGIDRRPYPDGVADTPSRARFAAKAAAESRFSRLPIALSLPGTDLFLRPLTVPFTKRGHIAKTLRFELEGLLLFDTESAVIDFTIVDTTDDHSRLLVAAIQDTALDEATRPFEESGLRLQSVTADVLTACALAPVAGQGAYAVLNLGAANWKLSLCSGDRLLFARAAPSSPSASDVETAVGAWYRQSIMAAPGGAYPERVLLTGSLSAGLDPAKLGAALELPVERLVLPDGMLSGEAPPVGDIRAASPAVAAAMSQLAGGQLDLYAVAKGRQGFLEALFAPAAAGLVVLTLLFALLGVRNWSETRALRAEEARLAAAEMETWKSLFADRQPVGNNVPLALASAVKEAEQTGGRETGDQSRLLLNALLVLSKTAPQNEGLVFSKFDADRGRVLIEASARDSSTAEKLVRAVNEEGTFSAQSRNPRTEDSIWKLEIIMTPRTGQ